MARYQTLVKKKEKVNPLDLFEDLKWIRRSLISMPEALDFYNLALITLEPNIQAVASYINNYLITS